MKTMKTVSTKREKEMACFASFYKDENKITLNSYLAPIFSPIYLIINIEISKSIH